MAYLEAEALAIVQQEPEALKDMDELGGAHFWGRGALMENEGGCPFSIVRHPRDVGSAFAQAGR